MSSSSRVAILLAVARSCRSGSPGDLALRVAERCRFSRAGICRLGVRKVIEIRQPLDPRALLGGLQKLSFTILYTMLYPSTSCHTGSFAAHKMLKRQRANNAGVIIKRC